MGGRVEWAKGLEQKNPCACHVLQGARGGGGGAHGRRRGGVRAQPYDRNKFLQANFRFLVCDSVDLRRHAGDADLMLDWDDVLQVCPPLLKDKHTMCALHEGIV